jgi:uncharacterized protein (DUF111 family)
MTIERIGYGAGTRDFSEQANILRLLVGHTSENAPADEQLWMIETNLDDAPGELVGYCTERLLAAGALDVYTTAVHMKKNRPGVVISVLCQPAEIMALEAIMFAETTTLGVRRWPVSRRRLNRQPHVVETPWGAIAGKLATIPGRLPQFSPEYEACRQIAEQHRIPLRTVMEAAGRAFAPTNK